MIRKLKQLLYFPVAGYFRFFAGIQLALWKPQILVITGSNSKTTLLHLIESQLGNKAKYSHQANSSFGIPFDILNLKRKTLEIWEWPFLFLLTPFYAFKNPPSEKIYVVEADCDRPGEGKFLSNLLKPEVTLWANSSNSHAQNFPTPIDENIAFEFGYFVEKTKNLCIVNGDSALITSQLTRTRADVMKITKSHLKNYSLQKNGASYKIENLVYSFKYLLPEDSFYSVSMTLALLEYLGIPPDVKFKNFIIPPGRSSTFKGIKNTTIIDSSYNATPSSMKVILDMFKKYSAENKWLVLGDMIELGPDEKIEHEKLSKLIDDVGAKQVILVGPRLNKYTNPKSKFIKFDQPKEALDYIKNHIKGHEVLLFKGARFLEGIIEHLLLNKSDISRLCRREKVWENRRRRWGL
ncbi:hypothetical protein A3C59_03220 [Candidatus Daviesbacteria bacterium RIFCSPHIGHO2_02_FULL_36_13]|uniref:Mur ligase C-terminal domain-containing protein n=1 Tax=Candidatus Daviesbacteria bacterium RIFCSPHIGHO2_02_FULL_36_13 TaxID=1797768 RepID=A0A1F5JQJ4_9BACT|nr:MAG: hypothetical protein A3C59_03220 [Candidatus Daviesbacteria bacterium RIFCSPHIGHO2_02_FULL_36_13]